MIQTRSFCLASASPRREALLRSLGLDFRVRAADIDERPAAGESPETMVARLALEKARAATREVNEAVITGDTIVVLANEVMGKPEDVPDAARMLGRLSGRTHRVLSAYVLLEGADGPLCSRTVETAVTFRDLPREWIEWYAAHEESRDKAGAYAVQGAGAAMVERIDGSYTNVIGLPVDQVLWDMAELGWVRI